ncbi:MAG: hypothetical protein RL095_1831 [Verrucomicrobiota bacterium]
MITSPSQPRLRRLALPAGALLLSLLILAGWLGWVRRNCPPLLLECRSAHGEIPVGEAVGLELKLRLPPGVKPTRLDWRLGTAAVGHEEFESTLSGLEARGLVWRLRPRLSGVAPGPLANASLSIAVSEGDPIHAALPPLSFILPEADPRWLPPPAPPLSDKLLDRPDPDRDWLRLTLLAWAFSGSLALAILMVILWRRRQATPEQRYRDACRDAAKLAPAPGQSARLLAFRIWCRLRLGLPESLSVSELAAALGRHPSLPPDLAAKAAALLASQEEHRFLPEARESSFAELDALVAAWRPGRENPGKIR